MTCPPTGPTGAGPGPPVIVSQQHLEPGVRLLPYAAGIVDARDAEGRRFGHVRFVDFVMRHHSDRLEDHATVLLTEWRAGHQYRLTP